MTHQAPCVSTYVGLYTQMSTPKGQPVFPYVNQWLTDTYVYLLFFLISPFLYTSGYCNNLAITHGPPPPKVIHRLYMSYPQYPQGLCISYPQVVHKLSTGPQVGTGIAWVTKGRHWVELMFDRWSVSVLVDTYSHILARLLHDTSVHKLA